MLRSHVSTLPPSPQDVHVYIYMYICIHVSMLYICVHENMYVLDIVREEQIRFPGNNPVLIFFRINALLSR